jgi:iron complex outermembrane receptor protein
MRELTNIGAKNFQQHLWATVSAFALLGAVYGASVARAADNDADHPVLWIELGGEWSSLNEEQETLAPSLMAGRPSNFFAPGSFQRLPLSSIDERGKLSFEPENSNWVFSASVQYGRSSSNRHVHQQSHPGPLYKHKYRSGLPATNTYAPVAARFADTVVRNNESHFVVDFQAGKDVGLGMFGRDSQSVFNLGIRFAQFSVTSNVALKSDPDFGFHYHSVFGFSLVEQYYHSHQASLVAQRGFAGVGPSLSWNASLPFMGRAKTSELALDWGVNAAILFGRQKAQTHQQSAAEYHYRKPSYFRTNLGSRITTFQGPVTPDRTRNRTVTVPNIGGFAGLSFLYANAKLSFGYRADLFFHAMDGGIYTRKSGNVGFYGPFASVSVGLGG